MIQLSNLTAVTLQPGQAIPFNKLIHKSGCSECWNSQIPTSVKMKAKGQFDVSFSGNITSDTAAAALQLAVAIGGYPLIETAMNSVPAAAGDLNNVSTNTVVVNCCCDLDRISVINSGTVPVTVAPNSSFIVKRRA